MLYVSRNIDRFESGVVDTDDGIEEIRSNDDISDLVREGIKIKGVQIYNKTSYRILPYQDYSTYSPAQVKAKSMLGVDVRVYKDEITCIIADSRLAHTGTRIRLSSFGSTMRWDTVVCFEPFHSNHPQYIVGVLDDSIQMCQKMHWFSKRQILFDITEMTQVDEIYRDLMSKSISPQEWRCSIIDSEKRMSHYLCVYDNMR